MSCEGNIKEKFWQLIIPISNQMTTLILSPLATRSRGERVRVRGLITH